MCSFSITIWHFIFQSMQCFLMQNHQLTTFCYVHIQQDVHTRLGHALFEKKREKIRERSIKMLEFFRSFTLKSEKKVKRFASDKGYCHCVSNINCKLNKANKAEIVKIHLSQTKKKFKIKTSSQMFENPSNWRYNRIGDFFQIFQM